MTTILIPRATDTPDGGVGLSSAAAGPHFNVNGIPAELKALPRWVRFDLYRDARGKLKKVPRIPGSNAEASNRTSAHWRSFAVAVADALARDQYVGLVFDRTTPFVFVDLDHALGANGLLRPSAARVVDVLRSYTELSAGGNGLHIICRGTLPERTLIGPGLRPIEIYPLRGPRFCVFTGHLLPVEGNLEDSLPDRSRELAALFPARPPRVISVSARAAHEPLSELTDEECAAIVDWARPFWTDGRRHHVALFLSGVLARQGVPREQAAAIIEQCALSDSDPGAKIAACHDTYDDRDASAEFAGWTGLQTICGLSDADLAPLAAVLDAFWQRTHPRLVPDGRLRVGYRRLRVREVAHA